MNSDVLIISALWPEPASSGAGLRMMELVHLFLQQGWRVTYAATAGRNEQSKDLSHLGVTQVEVAVNDSGFDTFVAGLNPQIVLFDRFSLEEQFGWRVERHCPQALRIMETIDLHLLRDARQRACRKSEGVAVEVTRDLLQSETALREVAAILRSDLSILVSDYEMELLQKRFKVDASLLHHCPFMFSDDQITTSAPPFEERSHFITVGNFRHPPNWDAVLWLQQEIWPKIRKALPDAEMHIYGAYAPPGAMALDNRQTGFRVFGRADDLPAVMQQARVCLAPLRFGAGIKTKLADAMLNGTPSVTTSIGAEGMHGGMPWGGMIRDDADGFAEAAVALYRDAQLWQRARANGFEVVRKQFDAETNGRALISRIEEIRNHLVEHRKNNFTGAMLRHHHQRSTEYMSRWIEAKNR